MSAAEPKTAIRLSQIAARLRRRPARLPSARTPHRALACLALLAVIALVLAASASADGDPASDWLIEQSTYLSPSDGGVNPAVATQLIGLLAEAATKGLSLKVAVIVTPADLGSVPSLFKEPKTYATFLSEEDYYYWQNELITVMPNGYGIAKSGGLPAGDAAAIGKLHFVPTTSGTAMVLDAEKAVRRLAQAHGIILSLAATTSSGAASSGAGSSSSQLPFEVAAAGVLAALGAGAAYLHRRRRAA